MSLLDKLSDNRYTLFERILLFTSVGIFLFLAILVIANQTFDGQVGGYNVACSIKVTNPLAGYFMSITDESSCVMERNLLCASVGYPGGLFTSDYKIKSVAGPDITWQNFNIGNVVSSKVIRFRMCDVNPDVDTVSVTIYDNNLNEKTNRDLPISFPG